MSDMTLEQVRDWFIRGRSPHKDYVLAIQSAILDIDAKDAEIARLNDQFMRYCALIEHNPEGWDEECWCRECLSYSANDDDARAEK